MELSLRSRAEQAQHHHYLFLALLHYLYLELHRSLSPVWLQSNYYHPSHLNCYSWSQFVLDCFSSLLSQFSLMVHQTCPGSWLASWFVMDWRSRTRRSWVCSTFRGRLSWSTTCCCRCCSPLTDLSTSHLQPSVCSRWVLCRRSLRLRTS